MNTKNNWIKWNLLFPTVEIFLTEGEILIFRAVEVTARCMIGEKDSEDDNLNITTICD